MIKKFVPADQKLFSIAKKIAYELNKKDGSTTDNKIMAKYWKPFALPKGAKDNVEVSIGIARAEISIYTYLKNNANEKENAYDLGDKWLNEVSTSITQTKNNSPATIPPEQSESKKEEKTQESANTVKPSNPNLDKDLVTVEIPVSANVASNIASITSVADKSELDKVATTVKNYSKHPMSQVIADEWATAYRIDNRNGEFTEFIEEIYNAVDELNITTTTFSRDEKKYPEVKDQIVDEFCRMFAQESRFNPNSVNRTKSKFTNTYGLFQMGAITLEDLLNNAVAGKNSFNFSDLKFLNGETPVTKESYKKMTKAQKDAFCSNYVDKNFRTLTRTEQLKYFVHSIKNCRDNYWKFNSEPLSVAQTYVMNWTPLEKNPTVIKTRIEDRKRAMLIRSTERNRLIAQNNRNNTVT